ncbi:MAG: hypothetical protein WC860_05740 [Candidatus Margulisiibacteriota bacterium]|jgi:hypothetical protein
MASLWTSFSPPKYLLKKNFWVNSDKKEKSTIKKMAARNEDFLTWFSVRWPKTLTIKQNYNLFFKVAINRLQKKHIYEKFKQMLVKK